MELSRADQALARLLNTASRVTVLGVLSDGEIQRIIEARNVLIATQSSDKRKKYKLFIYNILRDYGPGTVLVCAIALGQARITDLKASERTNLCRLIRAK